MRVTALWLFVFLLSIGFDKSFANFDDAIPGEYIVKLKNNFENYSKKNFEFINNTRVKELINANANTLLIKKPVIEKVDSVIESLQQDPRVEYVEPNYIVRINKKTNDPVFAKLWGLKNLGGKDIRGRIGVKSIDIGIEKAWDIQTGSKAVVVAIIDTGIDYNITDLKRNMWVNLKERNGRSGRDDDGNGYIDDVYGYDFINNDADPLDDHGHGTHSASTIGAEANNKKESVGVTWNVQMMALKFMDDLGSGTIAAAIKAIDYAIQNGAIILNNSWGGLSYSIALKEAIQRANKKGLLFVASSGNESSDNDVVPYFPANYELDNVVSVAAIDNGGNLAQFSNYGLNMVDIAAPGRNILGLTPDGLRSWSGTSMAAPYVTGVAALIKSEIPTISAVEIKERLIKTARPLAGLRKKTLSGGMLSAYHALTNTLAPKDVNDPEPWKRKMLNVSSPHPYTTNYSNIYRIEIPKAKRMAVHFKRFDIELGYDSLSIYDGAGNKVAQWGGERDGEWGPVVQGNKMLLQLETDNSVHKYGFDIDFVSYE